MKTKRFLRMMRIVAGLGAAVLVAGACTGEGGSSTSSNDGGDASVELASLEQDVVAEAVTIAPGDTHDADIAVDRETGTVYAAWAETTGKKPNKITGDAPQDIFVASSSDGGATWSDPARVNDIPGIGATGFNTQVRIAALGGDDVFVIFPTKTKDSEYFTLTDRSTDGGKTWGSDKQLTSAEGKAVQGLYGALVNRGKEVYVAYLDYREPGAPGLPIGVNFTRSKDGGKTFTPSTRAALRSCECCDNAVAIDSEGTLFIAYRAQDAAGKHTTMRDTAVVRSYNKGETWSYPSYMGKENWVYNGCPESGPELWVDEDDVVHGVYWTGKEEKPGVFYTKSTDGGTTFEDPVTVATDDFYPPPYMDLAGGSNGDIWVVWDDRRTPDRKVHLGRISDGEVSVLDPQLGPGITPAIDAVDDTVVMLWSDPDGLKFAPINANL